MKTTSPLFVSMLMATTLLTACGGGGGEGGGGGADDVDRAAPEASIQFPPESSMTDTASITVRGSARDLAGSTITAVRVNGVDVSSDDGFATWEVTLPLEQGSNTLEVATEDAQGNATSVADTAVVQLREFPFLRNPGEDGVVVDAANNRALVLEDPFQKEQLFAFDLSTGERTVLADIGPSGNASSLPEHLLLDKANNRVLFLDVLLDQFVAIDLNTGERTVILAQNAAGGSGTGFRLFRSALLDADNNRLLIMDGFNGDMRLFKVNPANGDRKVVSATNVGSGPTLNVSEAMALDSANNRVLVADVNANKGAVLAINLSNGNRQVISGFDSKEKKMIGSGPLFTSPKSLRFDSERNAVLIADVGTKSIYLVDLATGVRTLVSGTNPETKKAVGAGSTFDSPNGAEFLGDHQAVVADRTMETLFLVDLNTGDRQLLPGNAIGNGPRLETPRSFALQGNRLLVADSKLNALMAIDTTTGDRSVFIDASANQFVDPRAIVLDQSQQRAFLLDNVDASARLLALDLESQQTTVISSLDGKDSIGSGPTLREPVSMVFDARRNRVLILDSSEQAVFAIDLASGDRAVVSGNDSLAGSIIGAGDEFEFPTAMGVSQDGNTAFVVDSSASKLVSVNLVTGDRTFITEQNFDLLEANSVVLNKAEDRAFIGGIEDDSVLAIDLKTGAATVISDSDKGAGPELDEPIAVILDEANGRLLVLDSAVRGVMVIDIATGERVITSWTDISPQNNLF